MRGHVVEACWPARVGLALLARDLRADARAGCRARSTLPQGTVANQVATDGRDRADRRPLFNEYLLAFEVTSVLLLAAIVGAVVLGKRTRRRAHAR